MKTRFIEKIMGAIVFALLLGLVSTPAVSQVVVPVGKTEMQSSQLILWYDEDQINNIRDSFIQVTNASLDTAVNVHVQIFASSCTVDAQDVCIPSTIVICAETDFNDFYTPNDTHIYDMGSVSTNDPVASPIFIGSFTNTKGFVVITPIDGPGTRNAIAHQHMFGNSYVFDATETFALNAMGRDAVSFSTGIVEADGTTLDGSSNGYVLIQPEFLKFNFEDDLGEDSADLISIAFSDNYAGPFGYVAVPGDAVWTPLIFDDNEEPVSCSAIVQNCFFDIGINQQFFQSDTLLSSQELCPNSPTRVGWVKIAVSGLDGLENEMGIVALSEFALEGYAFWMHAEGAATPVAPLPECTVDADCLEGEVCEAGECVAAPECAVDTDCAEGEVCEAGACVEAPPECTVDTDCAEGQVCALGICIADPGGGGGCAIASTASAGTAAANALVVLIPLLGIGLRSMLRRREEQ
ncbi:MAG: hypothetical protein IH874_03805 [Candidatus Dadabacteria bacterium]|nr:hypothetical protein [Candidatus Dadabacteria bacterium]